MAENIVIEELLDSTYSLRPLQDKLRTENSVRPTPSLLSFITHHKTKTGQWIRHFCIWQYWNVDWYAACETANKLCCWPCVLLLCNKYEGLLEFKSGTHVHCCLQLKLFGKQQTVDLLLDAERRNDVTRLNEQVEKNRWIIRRFIDAVCFLANQEFPFWGQNEHPHP